MGGHHGPKPPKVPDWRIYRVEDAPELVRLQKTLAAHGLCDPWLRNEVWKFTEFTHRGILRTLAGHLRWGFKYGAPAGVITAVIEYAFFPLRSPHGGEDAHH